MKNSVFTLIIAILCLTQVVEAQFARFVRYLPARTAQKSPLDTRFTGKVKNLFPTQTALQDALKESALKGDVARVDELVPLLEQRTLLTGKREAIQELESINKSLSLRIDLIKKHTKPYIYLGAFSVLYPMAQLATAGSMDVTNALLFANSVGLLSGAIRYKALQLELAKSSIDLALNSLKQEARVRSIEDID